MSFAENMLKMLTSAYNREDLQGIRNGKAPATNIGKINSIIGWGFDVIQDAADEVRLWDDLDQARGRSLDRFGDNFGVYRGRAPDDIYRIMIKVKIISLLSGGNLETVISAAAQLFGVNMEAVTVDEVFPAKVYIYIDESEIDETHMSIADTTALLMKRITAAGVGMRVFFRVYRSGAAHIFTGTCVSKRIRIEAGPDKGNIDIINHQKLYVGTTTIVHVIGEYTPIERLNK